MSFRHAGGGHFDTHDRVDVRICGDAGGVSDSFFMTIASRRVSSGLLALVLAGCGDDVTSVCADVRFDPGGITEEWAFTAAGAHTIPLVADLDGDGTPEVVVNATSDSQSGEITLLDGATGAVKWKIADDPDNGKFGAHGPATAALADFDGDGALDIVYAGRAEGEPDYSLIHAVDATGALLWSSHSPGGDPVRLRVENGAFAVANLDDDPNAEIVIGATILDHDGTVVAQVSAGSSVLGTPFASTGGLNTLLYAGSLASVADVDGDGRPEIVTGRDAWKIDWVAGSPPTVTLTQLWQNTDGKGGDGWPALADLDDDGDPEVVLVAWPDIRVLDARTGRLWCGVDASDADCLADPSRRTAPIALAGDSLGGPATLADFDGDGRIEAGIADGSAYAVYDFHRPDEEVVVPAGDPLPGPGAAYVRWSAGTQDSSSASTGSSVFDLDGDGVPEVFYQDECQLHILDGATGEARHQAINSSFTIHEYPIVADVDGDGATEFLVIANTSGNNQNFGCEQRLPDFAVRSGVFLYGAGDGRWAPAAPLWTQHGFHITNADADGHVPAEEPAPWAEGGPNSVRQAAAVACE